MIKRHLPNWQDARVEFVAAGKTLANQIVDSNPHILHIDTGFGQLDHHQSDEDTSAAKKAYQYLQNQLSVNKDWEDEALLRMAEVVNFYDHFREARMPDATADRHLFSAVNIIDGLKYLYPNDNHKTLDIGFILLDSIYKVMQEIVWAEKVMDEEKQEFESPWGKGVGFETLNDAVLKYAQKLGYIVVLRKDPKKGYVRIKGMPET